MSTRFGLAGFINSIRLPWDIMPCCCKNILNCLVKIYSVTWLAENWSTVASTYYLLVILLSWELCPWFLLGNGMSSAEFVLSAERHLWFSCSIPHASLLPTYHLKNKERSVDIKLTQKLLSNLKQILRSKYWRISIFVIPLCKLSFVEKFS